MFKRSTPSGASDGAQMAWSATSTMLSGVLVWGGVGWLLDLWWGTRFATPIGAVLGIALGVYAVVARYGRSPENHVTDDGDPDDGSRHATDREVRRGGS